MIRLLQRSWSVGTANPPLRDQIPLVGLDHQTVLDKVREALKALPDPGHPESSSISDPTIALADAWATVSDVLAFYQERLNNESYIGTALEDRSVLELARMVGYQRDQGLAASCHLAYAIDQSVLRDVRILAGHKVRSVPQPGDAPQVFETTKDLVARSRWNAIRIATGQAAIVAPLTDKIYLSGTGSNLKPGDLLVAILDWREIYFLVNLVEIDRGSNQTVVTVVLRYGPAGAPNGADGDRQNQAAADKAFSDRTKLQKQKENNPKGTPGYYESMIGERPWVEGNIEARLTQAPGNGKDAGKAIGFRKRAVVFGHSAPRRLKNPRKPNSKEVRWTLDDADRVNRNVIDLEGHIPSVLPSTLICIEIPNRSIHGADLEIYRVEAAELTARSAYGMTGNVTRLTLDRDWKTSLAPTVLPSAPGEQGFETFDEVVQSVTVYFDEVSLDLGDRPNELLNEESMVGSEGVELDGLYLGLEPGRFVIITGDPPKGSKPAETREPELLTIKRVIHPPYPDDTPPEEPQNAEPSERRTRLLFKEPLKYDYNPKSVQIYGNVVEASHGESYKQTLGSGNAAREHQAFNLTRKPLTFLPTNSFPGARPSIELTVAQERWSYVDTLARDNAGQPIFALWIDDTSTVQIIFGNGKAGGRLPTGRENIEATYRVGLGTSGNIPAGQLKLPVDHPVGVQSVMSTRATGGSDPEPIASVRVNTPLSTVALDRVVTETDYLPLARSYPGVAKAKVFSTQTQTGEVIVVSILGNHREPLALDSTACKALQAALVTNSDGFVPVYVTAGKLRPMLIGAKVMTKHDASAELVEIAIRAALVDVFGFEGGELGQPVYASEALAAIQSVEGVEFATLTRFELYHPGSQPNGPQPEPEVQSKISCSAGGFDQNGNAIGAELALIQPYIPSTIILEWERHE